MRLLEEVRQYVGIYTSHLLANGGGRAAAVAVRTIAAYLSVLLAVVRQPPLPL
jgi:hypothetical protein